MERGADAVHDFLGPAWRFADPNGARNQRLMAAQGALPLPPPQLACVVYALTFDPDPEVQETATRTFPGPGSRCRTARNPHAVILV